MAPVAPSPPAWRRPLLVAAAAVGVGAVLLGLQLARFGMDLTAPFQVGSTYGLDERFAERGVRVRVFPGTGYDGQWFLGLAYDPLLLDDPARGFDLPRYRAGRPLLPAAGWLLAAGGSARIPLATLLAAGPLALALGAAAGARLLGGAGRPGWLGLALCAVPGVAVGVAFGTAEPLGLALVLVGLVLAREHRALPAGLAFAGAGLAKETYLVFALAAGVAAVTGGGGLRRRLGEAAAVIVPGALALALWSAWVLARVPASGGDAEAAGAVSPPLVGWVGTVGAMAAGRWSPDLPVGPLALVAMLGSLGLAVAGVVAGARRRGLLGWTALVLGVYGLCLSAGLLAHFASSMRALAPTVLATGLVLAAGRPPAPGLGSRAGGAAVT
ncbi:MAG TPA: hypothetical protein VKG45_05860 [Actinomycetes bacterium]|nr:hypothetical protein [Actinomycetes bacterium]